MVKICWILLHQPAMLFVERRRLDLHHVGVCQTSKAPPMFEQRNFGGTSDQCRLGFTDNTLSIIAIHQLHHLSTGLEESVRPTTHCVEVKPTCEKSKSKRPSITNQMQKKQRERHSSQPHREHTAEEMSRCILLMHTQATAHATSSL